MANYTENYNLIMPAQEDYYNVQEFNDNMEAIDTGMAELEAEVSGLGAKLDELSEKLAALDGKIGTQEDTAGTDTLYGLLKNNRQVFKSWNRYTYSNVDPTTNAEIPIQEVDASRCIVLVERTCNSYNLLKRYNYTLENTRICISHDSASSGYLRLAFTVIELY